MKNFLDKQFNHLKIHTHYSICEGALKISNFAMHCKENKIQSAAITDSNNLFGALEFSEALAKVGTQPIVGLLLNIKHEKIRGQKYVPLSKRQDRPEAALWLIKNYSQLSDGQIGKLVGSTKNTVSLIRNKNYWNSSNLSPKDPVVSNLCSQIDIKNAADKANKKSAKKKKMLEKENQNNENS